MRRERGKEDQARASSPQQGGALAMSETMDRLYDCTCPICDLAQCYFVAILELGVAMRMDNYICQKVADEQVWYELMGMGQGNSASDRYVFCYGQKLSLLEDALYKADSSDPVVISATISEFSLAPNVKEKSAFHRLNIINKCFSCKTIEEIILALEREAADKDDEWISSTLQSLKKASPTSLKISLRSIREGRLQGLGKCLLREYGLVWTIMRGEINKDFFEGCRAILLDKDKNPKWEPAKLEQVTEDMVDRYFSKINDEDWEDLDLPRRSNIPPYAIAKLQILS
ncbi:probable 3-hydroxyisobutyryl-CoA hydrolase 2 [Olea europaea var. sylvestris]|uniref:probable 3-hydroxyisobutyryl-CoA hydrolase 2 n=1 Tax=Olea europaea var. sylvestris TaxID=158386 RepID=UPI000C1CCE7E|nr:probable 3-hydroxyisobutyryl-CoA hydrolase 2 [Olea europaea var. sylvestris]